MTTEPTAAPRGAMRARSTVQMLAMLVSAVFVVAGIAGFIPGITTHLYGGLDFAGHKGNAKVIGLFHVGVLHNLVHLLFGIAGFALARTLSGARNYLIGGGVIYLALWLLGLFNGLDWLPANNADDWLHFGLGVGMIGLGYVGGRAGTAARPAV